MKTLLAIAALAAVIATPAFAQTGTRRVQAAEHPSQFDQTVGRAEAQPRSAAQGTTVYDNNHYLGADPDPNVATICAATSRAATSDRSIFRKSG